MSDRSAPQIDAEIRTYYGEPILKEPAWTVEVPWYLFVGGWSGASAMLAAVADLAGDVPVGRAAGRIALCGAIASPVLLILDLGRPARFLNMLRVFKVTSPLSVGSWVLAAYTPTTLAMVLADVTGRTTVRRIAALGAASLGSVMTVYTGVLLANTAIPVWQGARRELPLLFAASSAAAAGAATVPFAGRGPLAPRRVAMLGGLLELAVHRAMVRRLGPIGSPYSEESAGRWARCAEVSTSAGLAALLVRRSRTLGVLGTLGVVAGSLFERFAVFRAGFQSARDPRATVESQRSMHTFRRDGVPNSDVPGAR